MDLYNDSVATLGDTQDDRTSVEGGDLIVLVDNGDRRGSDRRSIDSDTDAKHKIEILNLGIQSTDDHDATAEDIAVAYHMHIAKGNVDVWEDN